jgi:hypothetical protein
MKKFLLAAAALASLTAAASSASAQPFGFDGDFGHFGQREVRAERMIEWCQTHGNLSFREAGELRCELRVLERQIAVARINGISRREMFALEARMDSLERQIRHECRDLNPGGPFDPRF